jgi:flavin-dependent dehydrogenase
MSNKSIAVIGGGIIGLYLGWKLQELGWQVTIFEKNNELGKKPCSALISERIRNFIPIRENLVKRKIEKIKVHFQKRDIAVSFNPPLLAFQRKELDNFLAEIAQKSGAKIVLNKEISSIPQEFYKIIACDGALSKMRDLLDLKKPTFRLGIQYFADQKNESLEIEIWPKRFKKKPTYGFFWKVPYLTQTEYGAIGPKEIITKEFFEFLKKRKIEPFQEKIKAALIPQGLILPKRNDITLCGDASGLTKPTSGGGVIWGLKEADILIKNFPDFIKYRKKTIKFFRFKILKGKTGVLLTYFLGEKIPFLLPSEISIDSDLF